MIPGGPVRLALKRRLVSLRDGTHGSFERVAGGVPLLSAKNISGGHLDITESESCISEVDYESIHRSGYLKFGDVLLSIVGSIGSVAPFETHERVAFQRSVAVLRPDSSLLPRFLYYQLQSPFFQAHLRTIAKMSAQGGVYLWDLGEAPILVHPIRKQKAIVDYLDRETERLDALVIAKERVLGLLVEKRRALITRAVTRGLDPRAPLRDSGISCLREIPSHWITARLKFLSTEPLAYGANESASDDDPTHPRFVRITDIDEDGNLREETFRSLPPATAAPYLLRDSDILFARSGATVGKVFLYRSSWGTACFAGYLIRLRCDSSLVLPHFVYAFAQSEPYWRQVGEGTIQATIQNFSAEKFGDIRMAVPPIAEQRQIFAHIQHESKHLDAVRSSTERTIALLNERRSALIGAAVTGHLEVASRQ
jgi:type I restriction enzyme S subunit